MKKFAKPGEFYPNEACPDYGKLQNSQDQNLQKYGKTCKGVQRHRCKTCRKTFTETFRSLRLRIQDDTLRKWAPRTPAMVAELTEHIWTVKELMTTLPLPGAINT